MVSAGTNNAGAVRGQERVNFRSCRILPELDDELVGRHHPAAVRRGVTGNFRETLFSQGGLQRGLFGRRGFVNDNPAFRVTGTD